MFRKFLKEKEDAQKAQLAMRAEKAEKANDNRLEVHPEEFIPYACHFDEKTLLTKNGELMQVIKITGFSFESVENDGKALDLRSVLRKAIAKHINTNEFAFWFHTLRRKCSLSTGGEYPAGFAKRLNERWCETHRWDQQYMNELYVTVLIQGEVMSGLDIAQFFSNLLIPNQMKKMMSGMERKANRLNEKVQELLVALQGYGARVLSLEKEDGLYYSEPSEFLSKIINLQTMPVPVSHVDLSVQLPSHQVSFGFNLLEVKGDTGKHYGALLSVKEYHDVSTRHIDSFLQLPHEFIISESFDYIKADDARSFFQRQHELQQLAKEGGVGKQSGIADIYGDDSGATTFGEHQITIMLLGDSIDELEKELKETVCSFNQLGINLVREDVYMEDCYWSQLPGNFEFIRRKTPVATKYIGGYASLYNFPAGRLEDNHWGDAVTVFRTAQKTPYFFNFHYENSGHTLLIGPYGAGKTVLMNFLVSEAQKYNPKLFYFDHQCHSKIFMRSIGGRYDHVDIDASKNQVSMNPFLLSNTESNKGFLFNWVKSIITRSGQFELAEENTQKIIKLLDFAHTVPDNQRNLTNLVPKFWTRNDAQTDKGIANLYEFCEGGRYAHLFNAAQDTFSLSSVRSYGFDVAAIAKNNEVVAPVMLYLLHKVWEQLDGSPLMMVLDEAWQLIDNPIMAPMVRNMLENFKAKNGMVIFATESVDDASKSHITREITQHVGTQIYLPNRHVGNAYMSVFGLSQHEANMVAGLRSDRRQFMLKHHVDAVVAELNLEEMPFALSVLSATEESLKLFDQIVSEFGDNPQAWLSVYEEKMRS